MRHLPLDSSSSRVTIVEFKHGGAECARQRQPTTANLERVSLPQISLHASLSFSHVFTSYTAIMSVIETPSKPLAAALDATNLGKPSALQLKDANVVKSSTKESVKEVVKPAS